MWERFWNSSRATKWYILNWVLYGGIIVLSTLYCYARLAAVEIPRNLSDHSIQKKLQPYFLPQDHPTYPTLSALFSTHRVTANATSLAKSSFTYWGPQQASGIYILMHDALPNYLIKAYLDNSLIDTPPPWKRLLQRCISAKILRTFIKNNQIRHFVVPHKWLYPLPLPTLTGQPVVLIADKMAITSHNQTALAWKTLITTEHLDELYLILKAGYGSAYVIANVPYTENGVFAFIDTEHPKRKLKLEQVSPYLNGSMRAYWEALIQ